MGKIELVQNGRVVASEGFGGKGKIVAAATETPAPHSYRLEVTAKIRVEHTGWLAARCKGPDKHPAEPTAAHTSPIYLRCGQSRAFDGPAAEHMLALVEGTQEYFHTIATAFDEPTRKRMGKLYRQAGEELRNRLIREGGYAPEVLAQPYHRTHTGR
jgi:hypothetical protein